MTDPLAQYYDPAAGVSETSVGDETVFLHAERGLYSGLDAIGTDVWNQLKAGQSPRAIARSLADHYALPIDRAEADVAALIDDLIANDMIVARPADDV